MFCISGKNLPNFLNLVNLASNTVHNLAVKITSTHITQPRYKIIVPNPLRHPHRLFYIHKNQNWSLNW